MIAPLVLFLLSGAAVLWALFVPGAADLLLLAGPSATGSLYLLLRVLLRRPAQTLRRIVVDGSNVMHWREGEPDIATVREVIDKLASLGYSLGVVFDANVGYKLAGRFLGERELASMLGLAHDSVLVVNKGVPADKDVLRAAREFQTRIVTNDRYRDWAGDFPEVSAPGHLIRGGYRDNALWLDLG